MTSQLVGCRGTRDERCSPISGVPGTRPEGSLSARSSSLKSLFCSPVASPCEMFVSLHHPRRLPHLTVTEIVSIAKRSPLWGTGQLEGVTEGPVFGFLGRALTGPPGRKCYRHQLPCERGSRPDGRAVGTRGRELGGAGRVSGPSSR